MARAAGPLAAALLALVLPAAVYGAEPAPAPEPEARCRELLPVLARETLGVAVERRDAGPAEPYGLRLTWRSTAAGDDPEGYAVCWFLPRTQTGGAWQLHEVDSSRFGRMRRYDIQQAYKLLRAQGYPTLAGPGGDEPAASPALAAGLYLLQQLLNGVGLGCVYALMAVGYTVVYGVTRIFNLAFGPLFALGAYVMVLAWVPARELAAAWIPPALVGVLLAAALTGGAAGLALDRGVFARLGRAPATVGLIAAVGLGIALEEALRLAQGPRVRYLLVGEDPVWPLVTGLGFDVVLGKAHVLVGLATALIGAALWWLWRRTAFGRAQRACAQDPRMAELLGVDVGRAVALSFALGGALVACAGMFTAAHYGVVTFHMGALAGLKALAAAVVGGIGSVPGAVLGGVLLALTEVLWAAYLPSEWKDAAAFGLLVGALWLRPQGLLGTPRTGSPEERG